ncbi:MAG: hypothetical protein DUD39_04105 [Coriobacteriaceae bacterium]|nr:MAG: hypothetical protein DUD39_04105 [Coriobacteriaceae bacterium]
MSSNKDIVEQKARVNLMVLQRVKEMGIAKKRELLERLGVLIAKKITGSTLAGKPKRCSRCESADFWRKGHV